MRSGILPWRVICPTVPRFSPRMLSPEKSARPRLTGRCRQQWHRPIPTRLVSLRSHRIEIIRPTSMTHQEKVRQWIGTGKIGTEIGAGSAPVPGIESPPIYVDCYKEFGSMTCLADYYGHAC